MDKQTVITELSSEYDDSLIGLPGKSPLLSWKVASKQADSVQVGYEIQAAHEPNFKKPLATDATASAVSQFIAAPGGSLTSREVRYYRVRIETNHGWTGWSDTLRYEAGLLEASDWAGHAIGAVSLAEGPTDLLRTTFEISKPVASARLYSTALGVFDQFLNGEAVAEDILNPGWTSYWNRLLVVTKDVTNLLVSGKNAWAVELGDGWYRGRFGFVSQSNNYGAETAYIGQLEVTYTDGTTQIFSTKPNWKTATGEALTASIYDGTTIDFNHEKSGWKTAAYDDSEWESVKVRPMDRSGFEPQAVAPVRVIAETPCEWVHREDALRINVGQNIAGWLRIKVRGVAGAQIVVRHAEVLELDGKLHTAALRSAKATDTYILANEGEITLEPRFTFHGFQYADIATTGGAVEVLEVTAIAVSSDIDVRGHFKSSHELLNKLESNTFWSLRDNFISIPTDCPQRDERLGWTGDAQAFSYTAHTLVDDYQFFKSWLVDLAHDQYANGDVPVVVPDILTIQNPQGSKFTEFPAAGWADAATVVPWSLYSRFGDTELLAAQLDSMRKWVNRFAELRGDDGLIPPIMQLGDWLDPDAPEGAPWAAKVSGQFMANSYLAWSALLLSRMEKLVGTAAMSKHYHLLFENTRDAIWRDLATEARKTPTGMATLLEFELAPAGERAAIGAELAANSRAAEGRIQTGFLGTPIIMDALSKAGHYDEAFEMLLRTKVRSWLYPITMGATTIWERWEAIHEDGSISGGGLDNPTEGSGEGMLSFNHYAYGAVVDWMYRNIGGISPEAPGYRKVSIAPRPHTHVTSCDTKLATGYGEIELNWEISDSNLVGQLTVPFGVEAKFDLRLSADSNLLVNGARVKKGQVFGHGTYKFTVNNPLIAR